MNKVKNISKKIVITISLVILNTMLFINSVIAAQMDSTHIYSSGSCGELLKYKGGLVIVEYAEYKNNGVSYPAYCLDKTKHGVEGDFSYDVSINDAIKDVGLWKVIVNGYPYKTIQELGVANKEEAFTATKQAVYCYVHGNKLSDYEGIGEAGKRTLDAMYKIIDNANKSTETQISSTLTINKNNDEWKQDSKDKNYISKTYSVSADTVIEKYKIKIESEKGQDIEGIKLVDENNNEKQEFNANEKFKILVPLKKASEKGEFKINVEAKVNTKVVLYGAAPNSGYQDYALTSAGYEDGRGSAKDEYNKNETKIIIIKQDEETKKRLEGVGFELLDENKNAIYKNLKTDEKGKIVIENMIPGKYYIRETKSIDGYEIYEEDIEVNIDLNQEIMVTVNNKKEDKPKIETSKKEKEVKRLPVTGM